jgi:hypothetical protein
MLKQYQVKIDIPDLSGRNITDILSPVEARCTAAITLALTLR